MRRDETRAPASDAGSDLANGFTVGDWRVRPLAGEIERAGRSLHLEPKVMDVLLALARSRGAVVGRRALLDAVWSDVVVSEEVLTRCVSELRAALGDETHTPRYVRTVPKRGYALIAPVSADDATAHVAPAAPPAPAEHTIAVLPFSDASPESGFDWFADGLTDDLIETLGRISGLRVVARTSAFVFKGRAVLVGEIGARLGVRYVMEGSVRRAGERLRVTLRLVSVADGFLLWSETFERSVADVLAVQQEIARAVALRLALRLGDRALGKRGGPANIEAYDAYLRGRHKYQTERPGFGYSGVAELERAVALDPEFAAAHGLHAYIHVLRAGIELPYPQVAEKVRRSVREALQRDPLQPEALMAKAIDVRWRTWDWVEVRALFEQALRVAPNDPHVITQFAVRFFRDTGRLATAAEMLRRAIEIDPLNPAPHASLSYVLRFAGEIEESVVEAERALALNPTHGWASQGLIFALMCAGRLGEAADALERQTRAVGGEHLMVLEARARLLAVRGDEAGARATLATLEALAGTNPEYADAAGWACLELGDIERGVAWLGRAIDAGVSSSVAARCCARPIEARRPGLLGAPSFQRFLRRLRLDDESLASFAAEGLFAAPVAWALRRSTERGSA